MDPEGAAEVWDALVGRGRHAGRARRARHPAPGGLLPPLRQRPDEDHGPIEAGLGWCCKEATGFVGSEASRAARGRPGREARAFAIDRAGHRRGRATRSPAAASSPAARLALPGARDRDGLRPRRARRARDRARDRRPRHVRAAVVRAKPLYPQGDLWPTPATRTTALPRRARLGSGRRRRGHVRDHVVRPGLARRGRVLRPARGRHHGDARTQPTPRSSRSRRSRTSSRRCRARSSRSTTRSPTPPRRSTRTPTARAGWSRSGCPIPPRRSAAGRRRAYEATLSSLSRYTSATDVRPRARCSRRSASRRSRSCSPTSPARCAWPARSTCRPGKSEQEVYERAARAGRAQHAHRGRGLVPRRRDVRPLRPGADRLDHLALGVPHPVHALPARDLPGRAAGDVRVPDGDLRADRAARLERLGLRGPERRRRRRLRGQAGQRPPAGSWSPAGCTRTRARRWRRSRTAGAWRWSRRRCATALTELPALDDDVERGDRRSSRTSSARSRISRRWPPPPTTPARCASAPATRCRSRCSRRPASAASTSPSARARRSATGSTSAARRSASSPPPRR